MTFISYVMLPALPLPDYIEADLFSPTPGFIFVKIIKNINNDNDLYTRDACGVVFKYNRKNNYILLI